MKRLSLSILALALIFVSACGPKDSFRYCAWFEGRLEMSEEQLESYFQKASESGIQAIYYECHGGYPVILQDSTSFRDSAALTLLRRAAVYAKKYDVELHAWMWTANRCEKNLRDQHHDWYAINRNGESTADVKVYNREHYRFLCPNNEDAIEYMKERVRELATVDGLTGIHMDFIRYPDAILPRGLWESRGVYQDQVYPFYDFCYCENCRAEYKERTGVDPLEMEDPNASEEWLAFRLEKLANYASEIAAEIKACGKVSSAAVFATPEQSRQLVRQDWTHFKNVDCFCPMIYNGAYGEDDEWIETAAREGVEELKTLGNGADLLAGVSGKFTDGRPAKLIQLARNSGADGICFFSLEGFERRDCWDQLASAISEDKAAHGRK